MAGFLRTIRREHVSIACAVVFLLRRFPALVVIAGLVAPPTALADTDRLILAFDTSVSTQANDQARAREALLDLAGTLIPDATQLELWSWQKRLSEPLSAGQWRADADTVGLRLKIATALNTPAEGVSNILSVLRILEADETPAGTVVLVTAAGLDSDTTAEALRLMAKLRAAKRTVHILNLSSVDRIEWQRVAVASGGYFAAGLASDELLIALQRVLEHADQLQQLPLIGDRFELDGEPQRVTLVFKDNLTARVWPPMGKPIKVPGPQSRAVPGHRLLTLAPGHPGSWRVLMEASATQPDVDRVIDPVASSRPAVPAAELLSAADGRQADSALSPLASANFDPVALDPATQPDLRIYADTQLQLVTDPVVGTLVEGQALPIHAYLQDNELPLVAPRLMRTLDVRSQLRGPGETVRDVRVRTQGNGESIAVLPRPLTPGRYQFSLELQGELFSRRLLRYFEIREPILPLAIPASNPAGSDESADDASVALVLEDKATPRSATDSPPVAQLLLADHLELTLAMPGADPASISIEAEIKDGLIPNAEATKLVFHKGMDERFRAVLTQPASYYVVTLEISGNSLIKKGVVQRLTREYGVRLPLQNAAVLEPADLIDVEGVGREVEASRLPAQLLWLGLANVVLVGLWFGGRRLRRRFAAYRARKAAAKAEQAEKAEKAENAQEQPTPEREATDGESSPQAADAEPNEESVEAETGPVEDLESDRTEQETRQETADEAAVQDSESGSDNQAA